MKRLLLITLCASFFLFSKGLRVPSINADDVHGTWLSAEKNGKSYIYKAVNGKYYGKIQWLEQPNDKYGNPLRDPKNPDPKMRNRVREGMVVIKSFEWNEEDQEWSGGTIYDPENGNTYDAYMWFEDGNKETLYLRGYVMGMTFLGRTTQWTRVTE